MTYLVLTNNPMTKELIEEKTKYELLYFEASVQEILSKCEELFLMGGYVLAADPMGGRRARPFPYLTLVLSKGQSDASIKDWERVADYSVLNGGRINKYTNISDELKEDYKVLDCSLTKAALNIQ